MAATISPLCAGVRGAPGSNRGSRDVLPGGDDMVAGVVIIKAKPAARVDGKTLMKSGGALSRLLAGQGVTSTVQMFPKIPPLTARESAEGYTDLSLVFQAAIDPALDPAVVAKRITRLAEIEYAEPKRLCHMYAIPNDPYLAYQNDALSRVHLYDAWSVAKGKKSVVIATIDGGTYWQHEDLGPNLWINSPEDVNHNGRFDPYPASLGGDLNGVDDDGNGFTDDVIGWNFSDNSNNPDGIPIAPDSYDHGTATASVFGAATDNGKGMVGTSWNCSLMPVCVASTTMDDAILYGYEGIVYAYRMGASVINCSWGRTGGYSLFEQDVINAATQAGALVVTSAGNDNDDNDFTPHYPASYKNVLSVGATNSANDSKASFSTYGITVPVFAPGVDIWCAFKEGGYGTASGTSFSSPLVAGVAGLLKSLHPTWTPQQIATQIRVTADRIDASNEPALSGKLGHGRVNAGRALTENHPGLAILQADMQTSSGKRIFLSGDTLLVSLTVKNVLTASASHLQFTATASDTALRLLQGLASIPLLDTGQVAPLSVFKFVVSPLSRTRDVVIKIAWDADGDAQDAYAWKVIVFPAMPLWLTQESPTSSELYSVKAVTRSVAWAAGGNEGTGTPVVIRTTDGGSHWDIVTGNLKGVDLYCVTAVDAERAWVGSGDGRIYATTDAGAVWSAQTYPGIQSPFIDGIWFFDAMNGVALGDPAAGSPVRWVVLTTTDGGTTWSHFANEPIGAPGEAGWLNSFWYTDRNHGWFGTNQARVWRTTDGGNTWSSSSSGAADSYGVSFKDNDNGIVVHANGVVARSTDGGAVWKAISFHSSAGLTGVSYLHGTGSAWVVDGVHPYRTSNDGADWTAESVFPVTGAIQHISFVDTSQGWGVTLNGEVIQHSTGIFDGGEVQPLPTLFTLEQNYPNPFNPSTTIRFALPVASHVTIRVYDLLGRETATIVNGYLPAGWHEAFFGASGVATGVYFYRLVARTADGRETHTQTRKLMVLK